jgi:hypothetical protein
MLNRELGQQDFAVSKRRRPRHGAHESHDPVLQMGPADRDPALIDTDGAPLDKI